MALSKHVTYYGPWSGFLFYNHNAGVSLNNISIIINLPLQHQNHWDNHVLDYF